MSPSQAARVLDLRDEIVQVSRSTGLVRRGLGILITGIIFMVMISQGNIMSIGAIPVGLMCSGLFVMLISVPFAAAFREARARDLRKEMAALSPDQQAEVLLPLRQSASGDTRKIVEPLIHDLRVLAPREVVPAAAPAGQGREIAPSGENRNEAQ